MKIAILELHSYDDLATLQDKMLWARAPRILLVWPSRGSPRLRGPVDLVLLRRYAARLGAHMAVVTRDPQVRAWALQARVPVFPDVTAAHQRAWRIPRLRRRRPSRAARRVEERELRRFSHRDASTAPLSLRLLAFLVGLSAVLALAGFLLPGARVELSVPARVQTATLTLRGRVGGGAEALPLQMITVRVSDDFTRAVRGTRLWPYKAAQGMVVFTNLSDTAVTIPAGLRIATITNPKITFQTLHQNQIPAGIGQTLTLPVVALQPGTVGNRPPDDLRLLPSPWDLHVVVTNPEPTSGGEDRPVPWPTRTEYQALKAAAEHDLRTQAIRAFHQRGWPWVTQSLALDATLNERFTPDQPAASAYLTLHLEQRYRAWAVDPADIERWLTDLLDQRLQPGWRAQPDSLTWHLLEATPKPDQEGWAWRLQAQRLIYPAPSPREVAAIGRGLPIAEGAARIQARLHLPARPRIEPWPSFWPWLPWWDARWEVKAIPQAVGESALDGR